MSVEYLFSVTLKHGADPTRTEDHLDMTPAHMAAAQGFERVLGVLESAVGERLGVDDTAAGWVGPYR